MRPGVRTPRYGGEFAYGEVLDGAIMINPHEVEAFPAAIAEALDMPLEERVARQAGMYRKIVARNINQWARDFLAALAETQRKPGLIEGIRALFAPSNGDRIH